MAKRYFLSANSLAPQAESRNIPGPLIPQWVISKGPEASNLEFLTLTEAMAETPIKSLIRLSLILKVNREGTGGIIACPISVSKSHIFGLLPVAITNF